MFPYHSRATAEHEDALERAMENALAAAEQKQLDELFVLDDRYDGGFWNRIDDKGRFRENVTSQKSWDQIYAKPRRNFVDYEFPVDEEWDDLHDGNYCPDCGSPKCLGECRSDADLGDLYDEASCNDCGSPQCFGECRERDDDSESSSVYDDYDPFKYISYDPRNPWDESHLDRRFDNWLTAELKIETDSGSPSQKSLEEWLVEYKLASLYEYEFVTNRSRRKRLTGSQRPGYNKHHDFCNHTWKSSNRGARKQWQRHAHRLNPETRERHWLDSVKPAPFKEIIDDGIKAQMVKEYSHLLDCGVRAFHQACNKARLDVIRRMRKFGPSAYKYAQAEINHKGTIDSVVPWDDEAQS